MSYDGGILLGILFYLFCFFFLFAVCWADEGVGGGGGFLQGIEWSSTCAIAGTAIRHSPAHTHTHTHVRFFIPMPPTHAFLVLFCGSELKAIQQKQ